MRVYKMPLMQRGTVTYAKVVFPPAKFLRSGGPILLLRNYFQQERFVLKIQSHF